MQGSAEAIVGSLDKLGTDEVRARIILSGAGAISESDVMLAKGAGLADHRLQRPRLETGPRPGRARGRGDPLLRDHLRPDRRHQRRALGHAGADPARNLPRQRRSAAGLRHLQGRPGRRLPGHRGRGPQGRPGPDRPRTTWWCSNSAPCRRSSASRTRSTRSSPARNAAWPSQGFQDIKAGDTIECFTLEEVKRTLVKRRRSSPAPRGRPLAGERGVERAGLTLLCFPLSLSPSALDPFRHFVVRSPQNGE